MLLDKEVKRTAADVLRDIETKLASIDGMATSDAFALGGLVREYGAAAAGESMGPLIGAILEGVTKPRKPTDKPWEDGF